MYMESMVESFVFQIGTTGEEDEEEGGSGESESEGEERGEDGSSSEEVRGTQTQKYVRLKGETAEERRERKKLVKEEKREGRQHKIPKHVKKRKSQMNKK